MDNAILGNGLVFPGDDGRTILHSDNFETGDTSLWTGETIVGAPASTIEVIPAAAKNGANGLRITMNAHEGHAYVHKTLNTTVAEGQWIWMGFWLRQNTEPPITTTGPQINLTTSDSGTIMRLRHWAPTEMRYLASAGGSWGAISGMLVTGAWNYIEYGFLRTAGATDGESCWKMNGDIIEAQTNLAVAPLANPITTWRIGMTVGGDKTHQLDFDDVSLWVIDD